MTLRLPPSVFPHENTAQKYVYLINQNKRRKKRKQGFKNRIVKTHQISKHTLGVQMLRLLKAILPGGFSKT